MTLPLLHSAGDKRPWVLVAAYDVSLGQTSEGHVAFNILRQLCKRYRIILITRKNNKALLGADTAFAKRCPGIHVLGYDLPKWASWWKRGARFYQLYAYLWQMTWPLALYRRTKLRRNLRLVHVLNFHNDSIPSLAGLLGFPLVWGPINHNEVVPRWRRTFWPVDTSRRHLAGFMLRWLMWRLDPFLRLHIRNSTVILSAGEWVDQRLGLDGVIKVCHRSQLGVSEGDFQLINTKRTNDTDHSVELICAGRLDWIKGVDLAVEALALLPANYRLRVVGEGPSESRLRALASELGVEARVNIQPPVPRGMLSELYAHADLFLFTSAEVAGLVWIEALASGLPVVAFDGLSEVAVAARHLPGIQLAKAGRVRSEQVISLATAIKSAADAPLDPITLRDAALGHYGWEKLADTIDESYRVAMASSK